jgi:pimeloyl-ACP methyl ester carboxylesterase
MPDGYTDHFFLTPDGIRVHFRDYAPVGDVLGVPVMCMAGLTRNVKDFEDLAPRIAAMGRRVIVTSQRGRGLSEYDPQPERYQPLNQAIDMVGLLDELKLNKLVFVGTSMGGLMGMIMASSQNERFSGAILNDIGPEISQSGIDRIKFNTSSRDPVLSWEDAEHRARAANIAVYPQKTEKSFWEDFARKTWIEDENGKIVLDYDGAIVAKLGGGEPIPDLWPLFDAFKTIPTLLIRGGLTDLLTLSTVDRMRKVKPDLDYVEVPNVGHTPTLTEPESWDAIEGFLGRVE